MTPVRIECESVVAVLRVRIPAKPNPVSEGEAEQGFRRWSPNTIGA